MLKKLQPKNKTIMQRAQEYIAILSGNEKKHLPVLQSIRIYLYNPDENISIQTEITNRVEPKLGHYFVNTLYEYNILK